MNSKSAYAQAGVDIDKGNLAASLIKASVQSTYNASVLSDVGAFGGLYSLDALAEFNRPVLVASTDGVGTKTSVAAQLGRWDTIGSDIVHHCLNDILVQGAKPLFFLDYVASASLDPKQIAAVVAGIAAACREANCALLGGETAEMPGVYHHGAIDLVGTIVGVVDREKIIDGSQIQEGDVILALPSSGLHTNGYTLARQVLDNLDWKAVHPYLQEPVGEQLLRPHRSYLDPISKWRDAGLDIHGLAHITGGGLIDNPPRIFPAGLSAVLHTSCWEPPAIFQLIQRLGNITTPEMFRVFNMGLGMLALLPLKAVDEAINLVPEAIKVGEIVAGEGKVLLL